MHERQRHELGEAAGAHLQVTHRHQMPRPMRGGVDMAEHDSRGGRKTDAVRRLDASSHAAVVSLSGQITGADLVVEDFRRRAGQAAEAGIAQPFEESPHRNAERRRAVRHLERGERMDMHRRRRRLHRAQDREIGVAGVVG